MNKLIDHEVIIKKLLTSYNYNYVTVVWLIEELITRVKHEDFTVDWTDEGDIIYGFLVLLYGDYGVSPRAGWVYDEMKQPILNVLQEELDYYENIDEYGDL